jgi:hypothetical protein
MMSSTQIAQQNHHAFQMGYGANPGQNSYESLTGFTPFGHGAGNQVGANLLGGLNSAVNTASLVGLGALGGGFLLNKLGLGSTAAAKGLGAVATMTGATLPVAAGLGMVPGLAALGGMASGGQQYAQTQGLMDRAFGNRLGMGGAFGYGVSRDDALRMTEAMRSLKQVPEMMTSMGELQDVLQSVSKMGIMQASRNATEFRDKFTNMVHALRDMSRDLGTTMKEATAMFSSSVGQGFLDMDQASINARMAKSASAVGIGMDTNRMMGLQSGGAAMLRSMGADSRSGAFGARDIASALSVANQRGIVSNQDIMRITGKVGEEGVADLSQQIMQAQVRMFQGTGAGRFITAALAERGSDGKFTGNLDDDMLERLRSGELSGDALMSRGRKMLSGLSNEQALSFTNAMAKGMGAKAGALAGAGGSANALSAILEQMGARNEEAKRALIRELTGVSQAHADVMLDMAKNAAKVNDDRNQQMIQAAVRDRSISYFKENMISGKIHHMTTEAQKIFVDPFQSAGSRFSARVGGVFDEITDEFVSGSTFDKVNMLINPGSYISNAGRLLFGDPKRHRMTQRGRETAMSSFLSGNSMLLANNNDDMSLSDVFYNNTYDTSATSTFGDMATFGGGVASAALLASMFIPGVNIAVGGALALGATAGTAYGFGRTMGSAMGLAKLGDKAFGNKTLKDLSERGNFSSEFRQASLSKFHDKLAKYGSVGNLKGKSLKEITKFVASMSDGNNLGIDALRAAAQEDKEGYAGEVMTIVSAMMNAGADTDLTVAEAENKIKDMTSGSFFRGNAGGALFGYANFNSSTTQDIAMGGQVDKQQVVLKILRDQDLAMRIARNRNNDDQLKKIAKELGGALTFTELKSLANDLSNIDGDFDVLSEVASGLEGAMGRINLSDQMSVAKASQQAIKDAYGTEAGDQISGLISSGGLYQNIGAISDALMSVKGGSARVKNIQKRLSHNRFKGSKERDLLKRFKKEDLIKAGIVFDDNLTDEEGMIASQLDAFISDLTGDVNLRTSDEGKRAEKLGLTADLQLKIAEQYEKAIKSSEELVRTNNKFIQVATDKITKIDDRVANLEGGF